MKGQKRIRHYQAFTLAKVRNETKYDQLEEKLLVWYKWAEDCQTTQDQCQTQVEHQEIKQAHEAHSQYWMMFGQGHKKEKVNVYDPKGYSSYQQQQTKD